MVKMALDILMTILMFLLMGFQFWGDAPHEWIGMVIFVLFLFHNWMNRSWYKNLLKGRYTPMRFLFAAVNILFLIDMVGMAVSSVILSRYVFTFLNIRGGLSFARMLHMVTAYWGFVLMALHLGLHWNMVISKMRGPKGGKDSAGVSDTAWKILGVLIALYGIYAFVKRDLPTYMLMQTEFVFLDYEEPKTFFYLDYLAIMGLFVFIVHYVGAMLKRRGNKNMTKSKEREKNEKTN